MAPPSREIILNENNCEIKYVQQQYHCNTQIIICYKKQFQKKSPAILLDRAQTHQFFASKSPEIYLSV